MKAVAIVVVSVVALLLVAGCRTVEVHDPVTKLTYKEETFAMKSGAKSFEFQDGDRTVKVNVGENDQTKIAESLISLGQALK